MLDSGVMLKVAFVLWMMELANVWYPTSSRESKPA
jgi:hypothetical protein